MGQLVSRITETLLAEWVIWARDDPTVSLNYPTISPFVRRKSGKTCSISDEEAMIIDSLVAKISKRDKATYNAVIYYYFSGRNISYVARRLGVNRKKADVLIWSGVAWVDAYYSAIIQNSLAELVPIK